MPPKEHVGARGTVTETLLRYTFVSTVRRTRSQLRAHVSGVSPLGGEQLRNRHPSACPHPRIATTGSIRAARRAGTQQAATPTTTIATPTASSVNGS
jgi:hypothetical protein